MGPCVTNEELQAYIDHGLDPDARRRLDLHFGACGDCRALLADAARAVLAPADTAATPELIGPGARLGRYVVGAPIGAGAMGVVFAAEDPELHRAVAIKFLQPLAAGAGHEALLGARMRREAQAMARLRHPNVVTVFDVGEWQDRLFIAMELVEGRTLRAWLEAEPRPWRAVAAVFRQAGEGLGAAHAAGITHRDFKPDNVLVGDDGRVCVSDFGLAATAEPAPEAGGATEPATATALTHTGAIMGTPRYMAPEQFRGGRTDARTDVFSFCVALYEALYGERPFAGETVEELARAVAAGVVRPAPRAAAVPAWLRRTVLVGLRPDPDDRHAAMRALVHALARDPGRTWRRASVGVVAAAAVAATLALAARSHDAPCQGAAAKLATAWNPTRRGEVRAAMLAGRPDDADRVERAIDGYGARWSAMFTDACVATKVRGEQSEELLDARVDCLGQRLRTLTALTDLLAHADAALAGHALAAVYDVDDLRACQDATSLLGPLRPRPEVQVHPDTALAQILLGKAEVLLALGRYGEGIAVATAGLEAARRRGWTGLQAKLLYALGLLQEFDGKYAAALQSLAQALWAAEAARDDGLALRAVGLLAFVRGYELQEQAPANDWIELGYAKLARLGSPPEAEAKFRKLVGVVRWRQRRYPEAEQQHRRALELLERTSGHDTTDVADALSGLGLTLASEDRDDESLAAYRESVAIHERLFGPDHVDVTNALQNLGSEYNKLGRYAEALPPLDRALTLRRRILGDHHPDYANTLNNHAVTLAGLGRLDEAIAEERDVVAIREQALGPRHRALILPLTRMGTLLARRQRFDEAVAALVRAHGLALDAGDDAAEIASAADALCELYVDRGQYAEALPWAERRLAAVAEQAGADAPATQAARATRDDVLGKLRR